MSVIDIDKLVQGLTPEAPCGENLEYDPAFAELERVAQGKPEQQMGDDVIPAEDPNWSGVRSKALEVLGRSKDLRPAFLLTQALANTDGLMGLSDGLAVLHGLLDQHWDAVHPQLDPDDDNDPTLRVNTVAALCGDSMLRMVRQTPLVSSKILGRFNLRDIQIATGKTPPPAGDDKPPADTAAIDAAFLECDLDGLQGSAQAVDRAIGHVTALETLLTERVGAAQAPSLDELVNTLKETGQILSSHLSRRGVVDAAGGDGEGAVATGAGAQPLAGEINSREDVIRALDKACDYFRRNEPSSPVPILLERAKRLVSKDFMEILRDMAPGGVSEAEVIGGSSGEES